MNEMLRQRKFLGIMGMLLPILVIISRLITTGSVSTLVSISSCHYYPDYLLFEGIMVAVGIFLIFYKGYDIKDYWLSTCAGICAILTAFAPCTIPYNTNEVLIGRNFLGLPAIVTKYSHDVTALGFFIFLIVIILFQFTKTGGELTPQKKKRNLVYRICGILMAVVIFVFGALGNIPLSSPVWIYGTFVGELIGLELFGIAWLIKGEVLFRDK